MAAEELSALRQRFGLRLRALREERGWTADETCTRVGCSRGYYYKLERGERDFSLEMLARLASTFRLDELDFFMFPETSPLRHGVYDLLRRAPEPVLLRLKLSLLEEGGQAGATEEPSSEPSSARQGTGTGRTG
jgi:transcriptional regulator with XRE-family HTH domain